ncbi:PaaX family transcriptional regulator C-terminal domain-containing protein [Nocardia sp. 004]|uniref:PaaX family transcriptional regulator C-terminal domain-containing protein n=1 Tax=Nocardia sp. 004 TaxID=3385978 RepID=UPI0039A0E502
MNDSTETIAGKIPTRVLLESMVRGDGTIDAAELYGVGTALGMSDQQIRLGIRRAVAEGRIIQHGRGRRAELLATDTMRQSLALDAGFVQFAYRQDRGLAPWDGYWHMVAFAIPEAMRRARDGFRARIVGLGGAALQGGLYVSPNAWEPHVIDVASGFDVMRHLSMMTTADLRIGDIDSPVLIARQLWPLDDIARRHQQLLATVTRHRDRLLGVPRKLPRIIYLSTALELAAEFTDAMQPDPLLPRELLPGDWAGAPARAAFAECWSRLRDSADAAVPVLFQGYAEIMDAAAE